MKPNTLPNIEKLRELRDKYGIGFVGLRQAFIEADGDEELAIKYLKGQWTPPAAKTLENRIAKLESDVQYLIEFIARMENET